MFKFCWGLYITLNVLKYVLWIIHSCTGGFNINFNSGGHSYPVFPTADIAIVVISSLPRQSNTSVLSFRQVKVFWWIRNIWLVMKNKGKEKADHCLVYPTSSLRHAAIPCFPSMPLPPLWPAKSHLTCWFYFKCRSIHICSQLYYLSLLWLIQLTHFFICLVHLLYGTKQIFQSSDHTLVIFTSPVPCR